MEVRLDYSNPLCVFVSSRTSCQQKVRPRVRGLFGQRFPGVHPLSKELEDSGYESGCKLDSLKRLTIKPSVKHFRFSYVTTQTYHCDSHRPIRLTQCCTQFKSPGVKILCVLYLHYNVAFSFKCMEIPETKSFIPKGFELGTTLS